MARRQLSVGDAWSSFRQCPVAEQGGTVREGSPLGGYGTRRMRPVIGAQRPQAVRIPCSESPFRATAGTMHDTRLPLDVVFPFHHAGQSRHSGNMRRTASSSTAKKGFLASAGDPSATDWDGLAITVDGKQTEQGTTVWLVGRLLFVLGTHDTAAAWAAARNFHEDTIGPVPFHLKRRMAEAGRRNGRRPAGGPLSRATSCWPIYAMRDVREPCSPARAGLRVWPISRRVE